MRLLGRIRALFALTLTVLSADAATVVVDDACVGQGEVTWSSRAAADDAERLTLAATPAEGFAFVGWSWAASNVVSWTEDARFSGPLTAVVRSNAVITASFAPCSEDTLSFDLADLFDEPLVPGEQISRTLEVDSASFPTIRFSGLPPGLTYDAHTLTLFGAPTTPGVYEVTAKGTNPSGFSFESFVPIRVANLSGAHVTGDDLELPVDAYFHARFTELFSCSEEPAAATLTGIPDGLVWNEGWRLLYGTPTAVGTWTLAATATFTNALGVTTVEKATLTLSVVSPDPDDYGLDLSALDDLRVGDVLEAACAELGTAADGLNLVSVSDLPKGLNLTSWLEDGVRHWGVEGRVREPGRLTFTARVNDTSGETQKVVTLTHPLVVADTPDVYLDATSQDAARGVVTGGGAVSTAESVTLAAEPRKGYVFCGWYDADDERLVLADGVDYRTPSVTFAEGSDFSFLAPVAHFALKEEDVAPDLSQLDDVAFEFAPEEPYEEDVDVDSLSLPTLTFRGLPRGVSFAALGDGTFRMAYDPTDGEAAPGRYAVTVTAVNASGAKSTAAFRITVDNRSDSRIRVSDDYGEFLPGEAIDPISLTNAVDFARGETLSVSGLPRGLSYQTRTHVISGTPTVPGDYTLTMTARVVAGVTTNARGKVSYSYETASATSFLTVLPHPELVIDLDSDAAEAGCRVTGTGNYKAGSKVTLTAMAPKGWVFAGWEGLSEVEGVASLKPRLTVVTGEDDVWAMASFTTLDLDGLYIASPPLTQGGFAAEWPLGADVAESDAALIADLIETVSWPTVRVTGLPGGVAFSSDSLMLSGKPKKSGVYTVTVTAKNAGGYSFVRVFDLAVLTAEGTLPAVTELPNAAAIDFAPLRALTTGVYFPTGAVTLVAGPKPQTGAAVTKVVATGLPAGLKAETRFADDGAHLSLTGTPTKPGLSELSLVVTYADGKTLKSRAKVVVEDGGSAYLFVSSSSVASGTVSGEGVYAAGATVKLKATARRGAVFAGWQAFAGDAGEELFSPVREIDGLDPRAATLSFPFRPADFAGVPELTGVFAATTDDAAPVLLPEAESWTISPDVASRFAFSVDSLSAPTLTVKGLPKGVTVDAVRGVLAYEPMASVQPGLYAANFSIRNVTHAKAVARTVEVFVANRVSDVIHGLDPDRSAYALTVGAVLDPSVLAPTVDDGWSLAVRGLPSGLSFKNGVVSGVPSKAGAYTVTFTATRGTGKNRETSVATVLLTVSALPSSLAGSYTGILVDDSSDEPTVIGTLALTATSAGKVSASVQTASAKETFSAAAWDVLTNGVASVEMVGRRSAELAIDVGFTADWRDWQLAGRVMLSDGATYRVRAQRNSFGAKDGEASARTALQPFVGLHAKDGVSLKVAASGVVTLSGVCDGLRLSGSSVVQINDPFLPESDRFSVRYVKFVTKTDAVVLLFSLDEEGGLSFE